MAKGCPCQESPAGCGYMGAARAGWLLTLSQDAIRLQGEQEGPPGPRLHQEQVFVPAHQLLKVM